MTDWLELRACIGVPTEVFFPPKGEQAVTAKAYCASCPVTAECLSHALLNREAGVWGGKSERQRRGIRKPPRPPQVAPAECGTDSGYRAHRRRGEDACRRCREAHAAYNRGRKKSRAESGCPQTTRDSVAA